jgi:hypothetical protein
MAGESGRTDFSGDGGDFFAVKSPSQSVLRENRQLILGQGLRAFIVEI